MSQAAVGSPAPAATSAAPSAGSRRRSIALVVALAAVAIGGVAWFLRQGRESTDDAQVDAEVVAVPSRATGVIAKVLFVENQSVASGDVLAELDDASAKAKLAQADAILAAAQAAADAAEADSRVTETNAVGNKVVAQASLQSASVGASAAHDQIAEAEASARAADATARQARDDLERQQALFDGGALAKAALDQSRTASDLARSSAEAAQARLAALRSGAEQARTKVSEASAKLHEADQVDALSAQAAARARAARAQVETAKAARDLAALELSWTRIVAPSDGVVSKKAIAVGQAVASGQPVVQLVTKTRWVTANFKETQVARMRTGQPASVEVDAFPGVALRAEVESLSGATGSRFTLLPPDNASGNFTKVVQRLPVRLKLLDVPAAVPLRPGLSVDATVDVRK